MDEKEATTMKTTATKSILSILTLATLMPLTAWSQDKNTTSSAASSGTSDKVDLKKLEDKYWSAKDDEYGVIQNRTFSKSGRYFGAVGYGTLINDPFAKGKAMSAYLGWYFNEDFGLELSYLNYNSSKNDNVSAFQNLTSGASPAYNLVKDSKTLNLIYTPFYAKMAFMNKAVLYFDMGFTLGVGQTSYEIQKQVSATPWADDPEMKSAVHYEIGVMQQMFINRYIALRLDIKNSFYTQEMQDYRPSGGVRGVSNKNTNDTTMQFSFMWFFNAPQNK